MRKYLILLFLLFIPLASSQSSYLDERDLPYINLATAAITTTTIYNTTTINVTIIQNNTVVIQNNSINSLTLKGQPNGSVGTILLTGGLTTVLTNKVTAGSLIFLTVNQVLNVGTEAIGARMAGVGFNITSTNILDASNVSFMIVEQG